MTSEFRQRGGMPHVVTMKLPILELCITIIFRGDLVTAEALFEEICPSVTMGNLYLKLFSGYRRPRV